jgi:hypothetical protein
MSLTFKIYQEGDPGFEIDPEPGDDSIVLIEVKPVVLVEAEPKLMQ